MGTRFWVCGPMAALCVLSLAACDGAPSANAARSHAGSADRRLADTAPDGADTRGPGRYASAAYTSPGTSASREG